MGEPEGVNNGGSQMERPGYDDAMQKSSNYMTEKLTGPSSYLSDSGKSLYPRVDALKDKQILQR